MTEDEMAGWHLVRRQGSQVSMRVARGQPERPTESGGSRYHDWLVWVFSSHLQCNRTLQLFHNEFRFCIWSEQNSLWIQMWLLLVVYELHFCGKALKSPCLAREPGTLPCILPASSEGLTQGSCVAGIEELTEAKSEQKNLPSASLPYQPHPQLRPKPTSFSCSFRSL